MAALLTITVPDPANQLQAFGVGAKVYIQRGPTDDVGDSSALGSVAIVAGTTEYEYADAAGTPGTDRYFFRYGTASPATADDYSGWTGPVLAGALAGGPLSLEMAKNWTTTTDTADDAWLSLAVRAVNRAAVKAVNVDLGPSPDTSRDDYLASEVKRDGTRLYIPGGIRTFTTVSTGNGTTWTDVSSSVRIGPSAHSRPPGQPGDWIEVKPEASVRLDSSYYVKVTGPAFATFGWDAWPFDLVQDALAAVQRMSLDRAAGGQYPTEVAALRYLHLPLWHGYRDRYFPRVR